MKRATYSVEALFGVGVFLVWLIDPSWLQPYNKWFGDKRILLFVPILLIFSHLFLSACYDKWREHDKFAISELRLCEIAESDARNLRDRVHALRSSIGLQMSTKHGPVLTLRFWVANASVYSIRAMSIDGRPMLLDNKSGVRIPLNVPIVNDGNKIIEHGACGEITLRMLINEELASKIRGVISHWDDKSSSTGQILFANNCPLTVSCSPGDFKTTILLPHMHAHCTDHKINE